MLKRVALTVIAVAIAVSVSEGVLRQFFGNLAVGELFQFRPGDGRCVALKPGTAVQYTGHWLRTEPVRQEINAQGFRGREVPEQRSACELRVALLGDSFTYGVGVTEGDTIAARLEMRLANSRSSKSVQVLNFGVPALNLDDAKRHWEAFAHRWKPDLVLYFLWNNDLESSICEDIWGRMFVPDSLLALVRHLFIVRVPYLMLMQRKRTSDPAKEGEEARRTRLVDGLRSLTESIKRDAASLGVVVLDYPVPFSQRASARSALNRLEIPVLDLSSIVRREENRLPRDGHLSIVGNQRIGEAVHDWLTAPDGEWQSLFLDPQCLLR